MRYYHVAATSRQALKRHVSRPTAFYSTSIKVEPIAEAAPALPEVTATVSETEKRGGLTKWLFYLGGSVFFVYGTYHAVHWPPLREEAKKYGLFDTVVQPIETQLDALAREIHKVTPHSWTAVQKHLPVEQVKETFDHLTKEGAKQWQQATKDVSLSDISSHLPSLPKHLPDVTSRLPSMADVNDAIHRYNPLPSLTKVIPSAAPKEPEQKHTFFQNKTGEPDHASHFKTSPSSPSHSTFTAATKRSTPSAEALDEKTFTSADSALQTILQEIDQFASHLRSLSPDADVTALTSRLQKQLALRGKAIADLKKRTEEEQAVVLQQRLAESRAAAETVLKARLATEAAKWQKEVEAERAAALQSAQLSHQESLRQSLIAQKAALWEEEQKHLAQQAKSLQEAWEKKVQKEVDAERSGRLARLDELAASVKKVEKDVKVYAADLAHLSDIGQTVGAVAAWQATLRAPYKQPFHDELRKIKQSTLKMEDPLVAAVVASVSPSVARIGIETVATLSRHFHELTASIRKVAHVPVYGGFENHLKSMLYYVITPYKHGLVCGSDVYSILARTEYYLESGDLDRAVREVNTLQGPARHIVKDWLEKARSSLEVRQSIDVLDAVTSLQC